MRPCPACGRKVQDAAQKCHYCGAAIPHAPRAERPAPPPRAPEQPSRTGTTVALVIAAAVALIVGLLMTLWR